MDEFSDNLGEINFETDLWQIMNTAALIKTINCVIKC